MDVFRALRAVDEVFLKPRRLDVEIFLRALAAARTGPGSQAVANLVIGAPAGRSQPAVQAQVVAGAQTGLSGDTIEGPAVAEIRLRTFTPQAGRGDRRSG